MTEKNNIPAGERTQVNQRLEYLRAQLRAERISYAEIAELQSLADHIPADDVELREAAGLPENSERTQLSFDGCGINGPDEYRTRICSFHEGRITPQMRKHYGNLFAAAPELLEALREADTLLATLSGDNPRLIDSILKYRAIIAKAEGRQS